MSYAFFMRYPSFQHERELFAFGHLVIGVDEAGCGCLAGPVIAAAVHLPLNSRIGILNDSKLLRREKREEILERFIELGIKWTVGMADASEVDRFNVRQATFLAMKRAVLAYRGKFLFALVDAWTIPHIKIPQRGIIHGDRLVKSIAAASIIAKVVRDRLMEEYDAEFPGYQFAKHKGYGTALHRSILKKLGPCALHRRTFLKKMESAA
jgi:ribonuclease HII